ncbi:MAG: hypothetical protein WC860_03825 [Candidatus Margulisiibacteriota bacterium]|jgi:DNA polymerase-3 subunit delta'
MVILWYFFIRFKEKMSTPLLGKNIKNYLLKVIQSQSFSHAYLFSGPDYTNKEKTAIYLAQAILCSTDLQSKDIPCGQCNHCSQVLHGVHPDLFIVDKVADNKNIGIEQIRDLLRRLSLHSFIATYKVAIIYEADLMTDEAANALLKTLEEPLGRTVFILVARHTSFLPDTIVSRCQIIRFSYLTKNEFSDFSNTNKLQPDSAESYYRLSQGFPEIIESNLNNKKFWQENIDEVKLHLNIYPESLVIKFDFLKNLLKNKKTASAKNQTISKETDIWLRILRDILFVKLNLENFVLLSEQISSLRKIAVNVDIDKIFSQINTVLKIQKELSINTNPQLTLENLYLSF